MVAVIVSVLLSHLASPRVASAHGEAILYTVSGVFLVYQVALALILFDAKRLKNRRLLALGGYALALGALWKWIILSDLEIFSVLYALLTFGIPAVVAGGIYLVFRNGSDVHRTDKGKD